MFEKQNIQETVNELKSDAVKGLTDGEAFRRLQQNGRNEMKAARKKTKIQLFLEQLKDPLIYILLIAAVVSVFLGELSDAVIIGTVVVVNALVGMLQEGKARKALEALKKLTSPQTIVIREGIRQEIPAAELVTGDLVDLEAGAQVPADIRLTRSSNLQVEESSLTGESVPVEKDALFLADCRHEIPLAEQVYCGDPWPRRRNRDSYGHGHGDRQDRLHDHRCGRGNDTVTETSGGYGKASEYFIAGSMCGIVSAGGISTQKYSGNAAGGDFPGGGCGAGRSAGSGDDLSGIVSDQNGQSTYDHPQTAFR